MLKDIFKVPKPAIGMVHLSALPGTELYEGKTLRALAAEAVEDAQVLNEAGFDAILFQNTHDVPARTRIGPETVAFMTAIGQEMKRKVAIPIGVNIHKVDAEATLAVAAALESPFVRLKVYAGAVLDAQGVVGGCAAQALEFRRRLGLHTQIWCDVYDITSWPLGGAPIGEVAHWALKFGRADALILTGRSFPETLERVGQVRASRPDAQILLGGGICHDNAAQALGLADGVIVGSALEAARFTRPISLEKARAFMEIVRQTRRQAEEAVCPGRCAPGERG